MWLASCLATDHADLNSSGEVDFREFGKGIYVSVL
jgi:hypothetical protein